MKNLLIFSLMLVSIQQMVAQEESKDKEQIVKVIIDYKTKSFKDSEILKHLKVNQWVQFTIENLPEDIKAAAMVNYSNRNLDLRNSFQGYLSFSKENEYVKTPDATKTNAEDAGKKVKENDKDAKKEAKDSLSLSDQKVVAEKEKTYKVDVPTMEEDLQIGVAENYLNAQYKKTPSTALKNAIDDIKHQQTLVKYLKSNIAERLEFRKNLAVQYAKKLDSVAPKPIERMHYFPPVKIENFDFSEFVITTTDKKNNVENFNVPFSIKRGFKLDFSTGFVFNGLYDGKYKIVALNADNNVIKREDNSKNTSFNTGIALLAHAYKRSGNYLNFGATTGFSFNLNNQNLNYMLGGSMLMGEDQRFILSAGVSAGKVRELVSYYQVDTPVSTAELPVTAQAPTIDKLKATWFFSISYNLGIGSANKSVKL